MSAFEFFFSFYGLLLGLSAAVIATGLATAIQHRKTVRIGWLTPMLGVFVALDITSFWTSAWDNFQHAPVSYGLLVAGLVVALIYFIAASLVFPANLQAGDDLDAHFWANKRIVLVLQTLATLLVFVVVLIANVGRPGGLEQMRYWGMGTLFYVALIVPAALAKKPRLFAIGVGLHILLYAAIALGSVVDL